MLKRAEILGVVSGRKKWPHAVVEAIDRESPRIQQVIARSVKMHNAEATRFLTANLGFLADAVEGIGAFTLKPLDIVAVGVRLDQIPRFQVYRSLMGDVARIVCSAYAITGIRDDAGYLGFPRYYLENQYRSHYLDRLPKEVVQDHSGLSHVNTKLDQIDQSIKQLLSAAYGQNREPISVISDTAYYFQHYANSLQFDVSMTLRRLGQVANS